MFIDWKDVDYSHGRSSYYIDLNSSEFLSKSRMISFFNYLNDVKEITLKKDKRKKITNEIEKCDSGEEIAKIIDRHIPKDLVYFYYGLGDDENDGDARLKKTRHKKTKYTQAPEHAPVKDSQTALEENLKKQTKKGKKKN